MNAEDPRARANRRQLEASDPAVSAFVAASAGSGKTKLLTDRLLRLMLGGADPARILCLTFTRAAAAEMAVRLQRTLGEWVTLDDANLDARLSALDVRPDAITRQAARRLFATVLDLPGGMRIETIHAFCQSLLRRFPLEAQVSPHFELVDDSDAEVALNEAREDMLAGADTDAARAALETLAGLVNAEGFGRLVAMLKDCAGRLGPALALSPNDLQQAMRRAAGVPTPHEAALIAGAVAWQAEADLLRTLRTLAEKGSNGVRVKAARMLEWLGLEMAERATHWERWVEEFVSASGKRGETMFCNPKLAQSEPDLLAACLAEQARVLAVEDHRRALRMADASAALLTLAGPVLRAYAAAKERSGLLDYDDLIGRSSRLLVDPGAAWVLYKLDGGLDHLLLDEVQDTAPAQWDIAGKLTEEFFAGEGARDLRRTVFAVGDRKQSIYSFQGADPDAFDHWRERLGRRVRDAGETWRETPLDVSFRSTTPVLALVDAVFAAPQAADGVVEPGATLQHFASRALQAGRVELWPLTPEPDHPQSEPWRVPRRNLGQQTAPQRLAEELAAWIAHETSGATLLESRGRALGPGDVLVLVRRRNEFSRALVRALKAEGVPVAGLDRMVLTEQPAVQDLLALCDTLLLPQDDLSLASVMTSPLGGLDQDSLMELAAGRRGALWDELRGRAAERPDWRSAHDFLAALLSRVDYDTPYALLAEALGRLGGRARLFARLGPEAAEPVDELLGRALAYGRLHPPSLQGFVQWLRQSGAEVKREAEGAGGAVRVMTVHGAKGLQAPLVILPDTTALPKEERSLAWARDERTGTVLPLWTPRKELTCDLARELRDTARRREMQEYNRLLYVALTRAEDRLVVCGWRPRTLPDSGWYSLVANGFATLEPKRSEFGAWPGDRLVMETPQRAAPEHDAAQGAETTPVKLPRWAGAAPDWQAESPPLELTLPTPLAPSRPEGVELGPVPRAASPLAGAGQDRFRRGQLVHSLLQHLPDLPPPSRRRAALDFLSRGTLLPEREAEELVTEIEAILHHPDLAPLFGPDGRAEVPLSGVIAGRVIGGLVDRLAVLPDRVLLADFKTNRDPPARPEDTPVAYLRQMAAYRAVLAAIHPERPVHAALVWTRTAQVMPLPGAILDAHAPHNSGSSADA